jgi:hypothetical protein
MSALCDRRPTTKRTFLLALAFQIWVATGLGAETVSVPLPTIEGRYYVDLSVPAVYYNRQAHFELERVPLTVSTVWIHISGVFVVGQTQCDFNGPPPDAPFPQRMEYLASIKDTINGSWWAADEMSPAESGAFEYTLPFSQLTGDVISWEFLKAGYGSLEMLVTFCSFPECTILVWPEATIEHAELIIEGQFPVAVDHSTWGSIKALYR